MKQEETNSGTPANFWQPSRRTISTLLFGILVLGVIAFLAGYLPMQRRESTLRAEAEAQQKGLPRMVVMRVGRGQDQNVLKLPGTMQALTEAPILARADGYLKRRLADIGDRVSAGQVLAEIDAPELDQQIHQAEAAIEQAQAAVEQAQASLAQGKANRELARITADRMKLLVEKGISPQQEGDQYQAQLAAQDANVQALEKAILAQRSNLAAVKANRARLEEVQGYRIVKAPFDGVVTDAERGRRRARQHRHHAALPDRADRNAAHLRERAAGQRERRARRPGSDVDRVASPGPHVPRDGGPHRERARSRQPHDARRGGCSEQGRRAVPRHVRRRGFSGARPNPPLVVPAAAILFRTDGAQVATVQPDQTVHLQKITVGRDYGDRVEILQGIAEGTTIVAVPGDAAREGAKIVPVNRDDTQK